MTGSPSASTRSDFLTISGYTLFGLLPGVVMSTPRPSSRPMVAVSILVMNRPFHSATSSPIHRDGFSPSRLFSLAVWVSIVPWSQTMRLCWMHLAPVASRRGSSPRAISRAVLMSSFAWSALFAMMLTDLPGLP